MGCFDVGNGCLASLSRACSDVYVGILAVEDLGEVFADTAGAAGDNEDLLVSAVPPVRSGPPLGPSKYLAALVLEFLLCESRCRCASSHVCFVLLCRCSRRCQSYWNKLFLRSYAPLVRDNRRDLSDCVIGGPRTNCLPTEGLDSQRISPSVGR